MLSHTIAHYMFILLGLTTVHHIKKNDICCHLRWTFVVQAMFPHDSEDLIFRSQSVQFNLSYWTACCQSCNLKNLSSVTFRGAGFASRGTKPSVQNKRQVALSFLMKSCRCDINKELTSNQMWPWKCRLMVAEHFGPMVSSFGWAGGPYMMDHLNIRARTDSPFAASLSFFSLFSNFPSSYFQ